LGAFFLTRQHAEQLAAIDFSAMHLLRGFFCSTKHFKNEFATKTLNFQDEIFGLAFY
jgi:hypothetical protein